MEPVLSRNLWAHTPLHSTADDRQQEKPPEWEIYGPQPESGPAHQS